jgi:hypothetical protein
MTSTILHFALCFLILPGVAGAAGRDVRDVVGVVHVAGRYHLTDNDFLSEGADQILDLGSRVIKVWFYGKRHERPGNVYPYNSDWPAVDSLAAGAQTPYYRALFDKPFTTYILVVTSLGRDDGYWRNGITAEQIQDEQEQFYELTKHLLTAYKGTGKTFVLQHWEGDWMVRGSFDGKAEPTPSALANMVAWGPAAHEARSDLLLGLGLGHRPLRRPERPAKRPGLHRGPRPGQRGLRQP